MVTIKHFVDALKAQDLQDNNCNSGKNDKSIRDKKTIKMKDKIEEDLLHCICYIH